MWLGWEEWTRDEEMSMNLDKVLLGALTVQPDTRNDSYFDEYMETVSTAFLIHYYCP